MIDLASNKWAELHDAYHHGEKIPALLKKAREDPSTKKDVKEEPWFSLWSSLCHQGDVYPASFAAVPHLASIASEISYPFSYDFFHLPATIEIQRNRKNVEVSEELAGPYFEALKQLAELASHYVSENVDPEFKMAVEGMMLVGEGKFVEARKKLDADSLDDY